MPSSQTPNYQLNQWSRDDRILMEDFNADNAKIDRALAGFTAALTQKGNCQIVTGQYTGTGLRGSSAPNKLTFSHKPLVLLVSGGNVMVSARNGHGYILSNGTSNELKVQWGDKIVSWYCDTIDAKPSRQMNASGVVYTYVVLLQI